MKPPLNKNCSIELPTKPSSDKSKLSRELKSKYSENQLNFNCVPPGPPKPWYPENLIELASQITREEQKLMKTPKFKFQLSEESAKHNWHVLEKYNLDLEKALGNNQDTQLGFGSEFKNTELLGKILSNHPLWNRLSKQLKEGASYPLEKANEKELEEDVIEAISFGNHKGVLENDELFQNMMEDDVTNGFSLVIPLEKIVNLKKVILAPMNIAE